MQCVWDAARKRQKQSVRQETFSICKKSQEVVICDAEGNQLADITDARQIDDFTDKLNIDEWKISEVSEDAVLLYQIRMYYDKAQDKKAELKLYENQYAEFSMGKQSFNFKIPQEVQEAVENLQQ